jgi:hypothetical protein
MEIRSMNTGPYFLLNTVLLTCDLFNSVTKSVSSIHVTISTIFFFCECWGLNWGFVQC